MNKKQHYIICFLLTVLLTSCQTHSSNQVAQVPSIHVEHCRKQVSSQIAIRVLSQPHRSLAFVSKREGQTDLWLTDHKGADPVRLTEDSWIESSPVWSPNGNYLAWRAHSTVNGRTEYQVLIADFAGGVVHCVLDEPVGYVSSPFWFPNSSRLGIVANGSAIIYDLVTTAQQELFQDIDALEPVWSPDGSKMAMSSSECYRDTCKNLIKVIATNGLELTLRHTDGRDWIGYVGGMTWSSDSSKLLIGYTKSRWDFTGTLIIATTTNRQMDVTQTLNPLDGECEADDAFGHCSYYSVSWSPDETQVLFTAPHRHTNEDGGGAVYIMSGNSLKAHLVACEKQFCKDPTWSPSGAQIAFTAYDSISSNRSADIWVVNSDGSELYALTDNNWYDGEPAWQP